MRYFPTHINPVPTRHGSMVRLPNTSERALDIFKWAKCPVGVAREAAD